MEKVTNNHKRTLGETGAGISSEAKINMDTPNHFTNLWGMFLCIRLVSYAHKTNCVAEVKSTCLWFFEMRELIGERPNSVSSGLGMQHWVWICHCLVLVE